MVGAVINLMGKEENKNLWSEAEMDDSIDIMNRAEDNIAKCVKEEPRLIAEQVEEVLNGNAERSNASMEMGFLHSTFPKIVIL